MFLLEKSLCQDLWDWKNTGVFPHADGAVGLHVDLRTEGFGNCQAKETCHSNKVLCFHVFLIFFVVDPVISSNNYNFGFL